MKNKLILLAEDNIKLVNYLNETCKTRVMKLTALYLFLAWNKYA
ncbi:Uncharacterised protein [Legionella sainthelensi]|nr:hypothetical protein [Legionella sainthelensi]VEB35634.1 Uncharacterised protein [Legionella sainthelensi]